MATPEKVTQKRPRIDPFDAARIDRVRGHTPFELFVGDAIATYLDLFWEWPANRKPRGSKDHEVLGNLLRSEYFQFEGERFEAAMPRVMEHWRERMAEYEEDRRQEEADEADERYAGA